MASPVYGDLSTLWQGHRSLQQRGHLQLRGMPGARERGAAESPLNGAGRRSLRILLHYPLYPRFLFAISHLPFSFFFLIFLVLFLFHSVSCSCLSHVYSSSFFFLFFLLVLLLLFFTPLPFLLCCLKTDFQWRCRWSPVTPQLHSRSSYLPPLQSNCMV